MAAELNPNPIRADSASVIITDLAIVNMVQSLALEIAHRVLYLVQANYITAEIITVDGGRSLTLADGHI